jgi:hypothetical protein
VKQVFIIAAVLHLVAFNSVAFALFKPDGTCARYFIYRNRTYPVDSSRKLDGEGLRFLLKNNNQSEVMLNDYQSRLRAPRFTAFTGLLGVALLIGGPLYASHITSELGRSDTRLAFIIGGSVLLAGSYFYGRHLVEEKEKTLEKAVGTYNDAVPEAEKIRVEITPAPTGTGGEIKTLVPF